MKTLSAINPAYLLEASLESLYEESREWNETIPFWKDENKFLRHLLTSNRLLHRDEKMKQHVLDHMTKLNDILLGELSGNAADHEKYLSALLDGKEKDEERYREKHRLLAEKMRSFENEYREAKRAIFDFER